MEGNEGPSTKTEVDKAKEEVAAAEKKVADTKEEVARAEEKVADAKKEVVEAKKEVTRAKEEVIEAMKKHRDSPDAETEFHLQSSKTKHESAVSALKAAEDGVSAAQEGVNAAQAILNGYSERLKQLLSLGPSYRPGKTSLAQFISSILLLSI